MSLAEISGPEHSDLVQSLDGVMVAMRYRLGPQTRYPSLLEDYYAAPTWVSEIAGAL